MRHDIVVPYPYPLTFSCGTPIKNGDRIETTVYLVVHFCLRNCRRHEMRAELDPLIQSAISHWAASFNTASAAITQDSFMGLAKLLVAISGSAYKVDRAEIVSVVPTFTVQPEPVKALPPSEPTLIETLTEQMRSYDQLVALRNMLPTLFPNLQENPEALVQAENLIEKQRLRIFNEEEQ